MSISTKAIALAAALLFGFASQAADPVEIAITHENGTFTKTNANKSWAQEWTSNATDPQLKIDVMYNNIKVSGSGNLEIATGLNKNFTMTFLPSEGWRVSKYEVTLSTTTANTFTITHNGTVESLTSAAPLSIVEVCGRGVTPSLKQEGENAAVTYGNFKVTLVQEDTEEDEVLEVDEAPTGTIGDLKLTNIVGNRFNQFTTWYHLLDANKNFLTGAELTNGGTNITNAYNDDHLYCIVGDALYNKAAGTATPVAGATVSADGITVNGAVVTPRFAQTWVAVTVEGGKTSRSDGNATNMWRGLWTSNSEPVVTFSGSANNMTTTNSVSSIVETGDFRLETGNANGGDFTWSFGAAGNNYIADYTFLAKKNGSYTDATTITPNGGGAVALTEKFRRIEAAGFNGETSLATFVQNGKNQKGAVMTDVYLTVRRILSHINERKGYVIYPRQGVERRIPAIARVFEGTNAGRLVTIYDYRHNGGDIGGGNISLQISVSDDNGQTWSEPAYLVDKDGNAVTTYPEGCGKNEGKWAEIQADPNTYWNVAFGDAAIVADRESGKLLLMAVGGPTGFFNGRYDNPNQCVRWISEDGGDTWTEPQRVTYDILDLFNGEPAYGKIDSQFIGSGRIMQSRYVKVGKYYRIYCVLASQNDGSNTRNWMLYSDDFGMNWNVLGGTDQCPVEGGNGDECKAEELPDGTVILAGRRRYGNRNFNLFRYTDVTKGEGKWTGHVITDMGFGSINACDGEIMVLPAVCNDDQTDCYLVLQSFPYGGGRNFVSIAYRGIKNGAEMTDASMFTTWEGRFRVADGASVYSTMAWQANDKLAFFWEDKNCDGTYLDFSIEEITDGHYSYKPDAENRTAVRLTKELVEARAAEDFAAIEGKYVGMLLPGTADVIARIADEYIANPSYNTYVKLNKVIYSDGVPVVDNGGYRFTSAHNGTYANFPEKLYLATDGTHLVSTEADDATNIFKVEAREDGLFTLYNDHHKVYADTLHNVINQSLTVSPGRENAGSFKFISKANGQTAISCVGAKHGSYPAVHLAGGKSIVIWTNSAQASQWYMELVDEPEDYEASNFTEPEYDSYDFDYEKNAPVNSSSDAIEELTTTTEPRPTEFYDLQGRRVSKPTHGIYLTPAGRKLLF